MYATFFGLRELPFHNTPDPRFFYATPDHEEALASLIYTVQERRGFAMLTGEVGTGKTLVSRMMLRHFGSRIVFASLNHPVTSPGDLLESLNAEFELPAEPGSTLTKLVRQLHDFLLSQFAQDTPAVLILDEAQNLSDESFELVRTIGNLEADDAKLLQILIIGQPELQRRFASPALRPLRQRISRSFHLPALTRQATGEYIRLRLAVAGGADGNIFSMGAQDVIHDVSRGLPRMINTLCDNALLSAYSADRRHIDEAFTQSVVQQMSPLETSCEPASREAAMSESTGAAAAAGALAAPAGFAGASTSSLLYERLATLVMRLENQLRERRPSVAVAGGAKSGDVPPEAMIAVSREQDIEFAQRAAEASERLMQNIDQAQELVTRIDATCVESRDRERVVKTLATKLRQALADLGRVHAGLKASGARLSRLESRAQDTYDRLASQIDRGEQLAALLADRHCRAGATAPAASDAATLLKAVERRSPKVALPREMDNVSPTRREPLRPDWPIPSASKANAGGESAATRLAHQVDSLLALVEGRTGRQGGRPLPLELPDQTLR